MLAYSSRHSTIRKSLGELGRLSGCSEATVRKALAELERSGIVQRVRCFRYSRALSRPVYAKNEYRLVGEKLRGSYTLVPRELLTAEVSHATFAVALYLYKTAGRTGRSWPSLRTVAKRTDLSKATICRALEALRKAQLLVRYFCVMANRAHSCNSYYPTAWVRPRQRDGARQGQTVFSPGGGLKFTQHPVINKIARAFIRRKREKGVCQFGNLHSFLKKTTARMRCLYSHGGQYQEKNRIILPFFTLLLLPPIHKNICLNSLAGGTAGAGHVSSPRPGGAAPPRTSQGPSIGLSKVFPCPAWGVGKPSEEVHALAVWASLWATLWSATEILPQNFLKGDTYV